MASLLGEDGRGYELAQKLESHGVWRSWLGDSHYSAFVHFLSSPISWEAFMRADDSKTRAQLHLQLRARALLFDKASISLFLRSNSPLVSSSSSSISSNSIAKLNPNYLQLHGDDVYFTFDSTLQDAPQCVPASSKSRSWVTPPTYHPYFPNHGNYSFACNDFRTPPWKTILTSHLCPLLCCKTMTNLEGMPVISKALARLQTEDHVFYLSIANLGQVDIVKKRIQVAYVTLQGAVCVTLISSTVVDVVASSDPPQDAEAMAEMSNYLSEVREATEFDNTKKQLEVLDVKIDSMVQPRLTDVTNRKTCVAHEVHPSSTKISFSSWFRTFYHGLLLYLEQEWKWIMLTFPKDCKNLVPKLPKLLVEAMVSIYASVVSRVNLAAREVVPEEKALICHVLRFA